MQQDYNNTINLPKTDFPMRAGLPKREPGFLENWEHADLYHELMKKNEGKPLFVLHDGPPYANGNLHMGHALNKILKDFILRSRNMMGYQAPYIPGWDTHGLPIERQAIKAYGMDRSKVSVAEFRSKCEEFAHDHVNTQREQFKRLGVIGDWDRPYLTLTHDYEAAQIEIFGEMAKKGYIYKGQKPVYWCPHDETALAEAEIEYKDIPCKSIFVKFAVTDDKGVITKLLGSKENVYFVIWTTTTWTIPGNLAISLNPFFEYDFVKVPSGEIYVMAKELVASVMKTAGISTWEVLATCLGSDLEMIKTKHPLYDRESLVIVGEHVTLDAGTGCVHTAPGFGADDFIVCQKYKIPIIVPVDGKGRHTAEAGKYEGMFVEDSNEVILKDLNDCGALLATEDIVHSYPHCWRCKNPIIFRTTEQWFCSVDALKDDAVKACEDIKWIPGWGQERMTSMIRERSDWCISRQRVWGVPIPIFTCKKCGKPLVNEQTIKAVADLFREKGSNAWFDMSAAEILPEGIKCECGCADFDKETDTMDVWFDSGSSWAGVLEVNGLDVPCAMYLEGSDQHRGWFNSSLLTAVATTGKAPYNSVLTHGFVVDGEGRKMSKSVGNTVAPSDIIDVYGADVMRLWVSSADYQADVRLSKDIVKQLSEVYRKIRNTFRFLLGNLDDFNPNTDKVAYADMSEFDKWALLRLEEVRQKVSDAYENYEFHMLYHAIHNFCTVDLSSIYLDVMKDTMYAESKNNVARRSAQTAMYEILKTLVAMVSPVLSFTAEEVWKYMPKEEGMPESVMLQDWPQGHPEHFNQELADKWNQLLDLRTSVQKALELARQNKTIGHPLDASVTVYAEGAAFDALNALGEDGLAKLVIVSEAHIVNGAAPAEAVKDEETGVATVVAPSELEKCERCWIHRDTVGQDSEHPTLCHRCAEVVKSL